MSIHFRHCCWQAALLFSLILLTGCGRMGDLYLPGAPGQVAASSPV